MVRRALSSFQTTFQVPNSEKSESESTTVRYARVLIFWPAEQRVKGFSLTESQDCGIGRSHPSPNSRESGCTHKKNH